MLSPEPGLEGSCGGVAAAGQQAPLLHPYSPVSPLAATPGPVAPHAAPTAAVAPAGQSAGQRPISPSSVCSNGEVGSSSPAALPAGPCGGATPPSVPRLNLSGLLQQQGGDPDGAPGGTSGIEVSFGAALGVVASPDDGELPTARLSPVAPERGQGATEPEAGATAEARPPGTFVPSSITFCLPGNSPTHAVFKQEPGEHGETHACSLYGCLLMATFAAGATGCCALLSSWQNTNNPPHAALQRLRHPLSLLRLATCLPLLAARQRQRSMASLRPRQPLSQGQPRHAKPAIQRPALCCRGSALARRCSSTRCTTPCSTTCGARSMPRQRALLCRSVLTARNRRSSAPRCTSSPPPTPPLPTVRCLPASTTERDPPICRQAHALMCIVWPLTARALLLKATSAVLLWPAGTISRALVATPAPGQGSLTIWMDRRGMRAALNTPARNDLRLLWAAARDVCTYQSGVGGRQPVVLGLWSKACSSPLLARLPEALPLAHFNLCLLLPKRTCRGGDSAC